MIKVSFMSHKQEVRSCANYSKYYSSFVCKKLGYNAVDYEVVGNYHSMDANANEN